MNKNLLKSMQVRVDGKVFHGIKILVLGLPNAFFRCKKKGNYIKYCPYKSFPLRRPLHWDNHDCQEITNEEKLLKMSKLKERVAREEVNEASYIGRESMKEQNKSGEQEQRTNSKELKKEMIKEGRIIHVDEATSRVTSGEQQCMDIAA